MKKSFVKGLLTFAMVLLVAFSVSAQPVEEQATVATTQIFVDDLGREVELPSDIQRIAPSGSNAQVIVYQICPEKLCGLAASLSAKEQEIYLDSLADLPAFGTLYGKKKNLNKETVIMANPDVFIDVGDIKGSKEDMAAELDQVQEDIGVPVIFFEANIYNYESVFERLGTLLGYEERGKQLAAYAKEAREFALENPRDGKTVYFTSSADGLEAYLAEKSHSEAISVAGGKNVVSSKIAQSNGTVSLETLYTLNPEIILCTSEEGYKTITTSAEWANLDAVKNGQVYKTPSLPHGFVTGPPCSNRIIGLFWLTYIMYPERNVDIVAKTIEFYSLFYHCELTEAQAKEILYLN